MFYKNLLWKILQNVQESKYARVSFYKKLQAAVITSCFASIADQNLLENLLEAYPGIPKTSKMERFAAAVNYCCYVFYLPCLQDSWIDLSVFQ